MAKYKHLTLSERYDIEKYLNQRFNYSEIGRLLNKSDRTIAYEIKKYVFSSYRKPLLKLIKVGYNKLKRL